DARRAIRAVSPPGDLWSRLLQLGDRGWVEVVAWESLDLFERSLERAPQDPTAGAWFALAERGWSILTGALASPVDPPPPAGELELVWSREGEALPASSSEHAWSMDVKLDPRTWVDPSGWTGRDPGTLRVNAPPSSPGSATESPVSRREVATIASSIESALGGPGT